MPREFRVGQKYRRRDIYRIIGISEDTHGGNWDTGYNRLGNDWFIFCNIGIPGRTGHDYPNEWVGNCLHWYGKTRAKLSHASIQSMIAGTGDVYIFWRNDDQSPFTYAGCGRAVATEDVVPVKIVWTFDSSERQ